jgi:hypothetical protein
MHANTATILLSNQQHDESQVMMNSKTMTAVRHTVNVVTALPPLLHTAIQH